MGIHIDATTLSASFDNDHVGTVRPSDMSDRIQFVIGMSEGVHLRDIQHYRKFIGVRTVGTKALWLLRGLGVIDDHISFDPCISLHESETYNIFPG